MPVCITYCPQVTGTAYSITSGRGYKAGTTCTVQTLDNIYKIYKLNYKKIRNNKKNDDFNVMKSLGVKNVYFRQKIMLTK